MSAQRGRLPTDSYKRLPSLTCLLETRHSTLSSSNWTVSEFAKRSMIWSSPEKAVAAGTGG
ncbi:hypothetical protein ABH995_004939 [Bradyrhizobium yuanmingense]